MPFDFGTGSSQASRVLAYEDVLELRAVEEVQLRVVDSTDQLGVVEEGLAPEGPASEALALDSPDTAVCGPGVMDGKEVYKEMPEEFKDADFENFENFEEDYSTVFEDDLSIKVPWVFAGASYEHLKATRSVYNR